MDLTSLMPIVRIEIKASVIHSHNHQTVHLIRTLEPISAHCHQKGAILWGLRWSCIVV